MLDRATEVMPEALLAPAHQDGTICLDVAIDIGNSGTAVLAWKSGTNDAPTLVTFDTIKSEFCRGMRRVLADRGETELRAGEHIIGIADGDTMLETFVGSLVLTTDSEPAYAWQNTERYSNGWNLDMLYAGIAAAADGATEIIARVSTGMPAALWADQQAMVIRTLKGEHHFQYNGRNIRLVITDVFVGREVQEAWKAIDPAQRTGVTLMLNWGGYTLDMALIGEDGEIVGNPTTRPIGAEVVLDEISAHLPRPLTMRERGELKVAIRTGAAYSYTVDGKDVQVDTIARPYFRKAVRNFVQRISQVVPLRAIRNVWMGGGSVYLMGEDVRREFAPHNVTLQTPAEYPELMTVVGYSKVLGGAAYKPAKIKSRKSAKGR